MKWMLFGSHESSDDVLVFFFCTLKSLVIELFITLLFTTSRIHIRTAAKCLFIIITLVDVFFRLDFGCQQHLNADPSMSFWKERTEQTKPNRTEPGRIDRVYLNERLSSGCCASPFSSSFSSSSSSFSFFSTKDLHYTRIFNSECRAFPLLKDFLFILSSDG